MVSLSDYSCLFDTPTILNATKINSFPKKKTLAEFDL